MAMPFKKIEALEKKPEAFEKKPEFKEKPEKGEKDHKDKLEREKCHKDEVKESKDREDKQNQEKLSKDGQDKHNWEKQHKEKCESGEGDFGLAATDPAMHERLSRIEAAVEELRHFIKPENRPDLSEGALAHEDDVEKGQG
jgi:hypothetical protein